MNTYKLSTAFFLVLFVIIGVLSSFQGASAQICNDSDGDNNLPPNPDFSSLNLTQSGICENSAERTFFDRCSTSLSAITEHWCQKDDGTCYFRQGACPSIAPTCLKIVDSSNTVIGGKCVECIEDSNCSEGGTCDTSTNTCIAAPEPDPTPTPTPTLTPDPTPGGGAVTLPNPLQINSLQELLNRVLNLLILFATPVYLLIIFLGALTLIVGGADPSKRRLAKNMLLYATIGFLILVMARALLKAVETFFILK